LKTSISTKALQLPPGYQIDLNKWQYIYRFILSYTKEFTDILEVLQSDEQQDFTPPLLTKPPGKPGLIQIFYNLLPNNIGFHINQQLNQKQIRLLWDFKDYIALFQQVSSMYNDCSIMFEVNAKRLESSTIINESGESKKTVSGSNIFPCITQRVSC
jgi:hypothetical protein